MPYYTDEELENLNFKRLGKNVKVSKNACIYDHSLIEIGDNSRIDDLCVVSGNVMIGRNVHIAPMCLIAGGEEGVFLEDFTGMAYGAKVFSQSDDYTGETLTNPTIPKDFKKEIKIKTVLMKHCILGTNSIVLPGVILAEGTAVGAMSLVTKSTESWGMYFGTPAKRYKNRKKDMLKLETDYLKLENVNQ